MSWQREREITQSVSRQAISEQTCPFLTHGLADFLKWGSIPNIDHDEHSKACHDKTSNKNCVGQGRPPCNLTCSRLILNPAKRLPCRLAPVMSHHEDLPERGKRNAKAAQNCLHKRTSIVLVSVLNRASPSGTRPRRFLYTMCASKALLNSARIACSVQLRHRGCLFSTMLRSLYFTRGFIISHSSRLRGRPLCQLPVGGANSGGKQTRRIAS